MGKPSDYQELRDEFLTTINMKQWIKFNLNIFDFLVKSVIFEWTWFEFQPLKLQALYVEPEDFAALMYQMRNIDLSQVEANFAISYYLDALSLKLYVVDYPTYCVTDLVSIVRSHHFIECGHHGNQRRVAPLHAVDPNINYSALRWLLPHYYGTHDYVFVTVGDVLQFLKTGIVYHKD